MPSALYEYLTSFLHCSVGGKIGSRQWREERHSIGMESWPLCCYSLDFGGLGVGEGSRHGCLGKAWKYPQHCEGAIEIVGRVLCFLQKGCNIDCGY